VQPCEPRGVRLFSDLQYFGSVGSFIAGHKSNELWLLFLKTMRTICLLKSILAII
jgi:hypothetical protein